MIYALPDLYQQPIDEANKQPVYFSTLRDYRVEFTLQNYSETQLLPAPIAEFTAFNLPEPAAFIGLAVDDTLSEDVTRVIRRQLQQNSQVIIVGLQPDMAAEKESFSSNAMKVTLLHTDNVALQAQPLVLLTDLMPTVLSGYMNCVDNADAYSIGINLTDEQRRMPVMTSFGHDLVVYDEQMTSIIKADASIRTFDNAELKLLPGVSPATPVLVDGIRKLKRFSRDKDNE